MNWPRVILDGLSMSLLFNAVAGLGFLLVPQAYSTMFPKEIKLAAAPFVEKKDVRTMKLILYPLYLVLFVYWAVSAHFAGMTGFWNLFWAGYIEMTMVSLSDFIILDCWLPPKAKPYPILLFPSFRSISGSTNWNLTVQIKYNIRFILL